MTALSTPTGGNLNHSQPSAGSRNCSVFCFLALLSLRSCGASPHLCVNQCSAQVLRPFYTSPELPPFSNSLSRVLPTGLASSASIPVLSTQLQALLGIPRSFASAWKLSPGQSTDAVSGVVSGSEGPPSYPLPAV